MRYSSGEYVSNSIPISQEMSGGTNGPRSVTWRSREIEALTNCIQKHTLPSWWPLAEIVLHQVPSVISEPGLFKFLGWFHVFQCFEVWVECSTVMGTKQTNSLEDWKDSCKVQLEAEFIWAGFGVPFLLPAQEMLLYPAASEAVKGFEGSCPYKVQTESWHSRWPNSKEGDTNSDWACWSEWLERQKWRFVNVFRSLKGSVKWGP